MRFFSRCRILAGVLSFLCGLLGFGLAFRLIFMLRSDGLALFSRLSDRELTGLLFQILLFVILLMAVIALRCIIRDAQEDLDAVTNYLKNRESDRE